MGVIPEGLTAIEKIEGLDHEVMRAIASKETPIWLARAMDHGLKCDPVDASHYFETAAEMFKRRVERIFQRSGSFGGVDHPSDEQRGAS